MEDAIRWVSLPCTLLVLRWQTALASGRVPASLFSAPLTGEGEAANLIKGMGVSEGGREPISPLSFALQIDASVSGFMWPQMCKMSSAVSSSSAVRSSAPALQLDDSSAHFQHVIQPHPLRPAGLNRATRMSFVLTVRLRYL